MVLTSRVKKGQHVPLRGGEGLGQGLSGSSGDFFGSAVSDLMVTPRVESFNPKPLGPNTY